MLVEDRILDLDQQVADTDPKTPRFILVKEGLHNPPPVIQIVTPQGGDQSQVMSRFPEKDQLNPQCGLPIMASNEDVASNPDGHPVNPAERERTPEAQNDPIVPASGSHLMASPRSVNKAETPLNQSFSQTDSDLAQLAAEIKAAS